MNMTINCSIMQNWEKMVKKIYILILHTNGFYYSEYRHHKIDDLWSRLVIICTKQTKLRSQTTSLNTK